MSASSWTEDRLERLVQLWAEGLSAAEVALRLGGVTRNAVLGKIHRLGLSGSRPASRSRPRAAPRPRKAPPSPTRRARNRWKSAASVDGPGLISDLLALGPHMCRWPIGDPKSSDFTFCGARCAERYCERHAARAFQRGIALRRSAAAGVVPTGAASSLPASRRGVTVT